MFRVTRINLSACLALLWLSGIAPVNAAPPNAAPADPAANPVFDTMDWRLASPGLEGGIIDKGSPTLADLSGDGIPEVIVGTTAYNGAGSYNKKSLLVALKWDGGSDADNMEIWFATDVGAPINSTPAVADIDGDGLPEIVVGLGGDVPDKDQHGGVAVYEHNGAFKWFFKTHDDYHSPDGYSEGVFSSPTLCDVDSDGDLEIAFGSWDQRIYLLDHEGNSLWSTPGWDAGHFNQDTVWSSAACADLNQDGYKEIIIGADMTHGTLIDGTSVQDGGMLYIFDYNGNVLVRRYIEEAIYAAPAVGDLDGDGDLEIVSGTSFAWWQAHECPDKCSDQPRVYVFDTSQVFGPKNYYDPTKLPNAPGWPKNTTYPGFSSPALADLDGNGDLEIVIGSGDPFQNSGDVVPGEGKVYAWHHDGAPVGGWPVEPKSRSPFFYDTYVASSPTIADVDGDGGLEIMFAMLHDVHVYNVDGSPQPLTQLNTYVSANGLLQTRDGCLWSSPTVGDADGDGNVEIWIGGGDNLDPGVGHLWRFEADKPVGKAPWHSFHRDVQNRGLYGTPELDAAPGFIYVMHEYGSGSPESDVMLVFNTGDGEIDWQATSPSPVTLSAYYGTVDGAGQAVTVTIPTSGYSKGTHFLGNITITGTIEGDAAPGSPITIPVTLYVGTIHRIYAPMILAGY
ncbi:MAG: VCBS repeat-containing protein [Anaerolineae bacterium]|nr:VCBS repeat-containing protein [Anaerolineae bacterium]